MRLFTETLIAPFAHPQALQARSHGLIETCDGRLVAIHLRPWPKFISALEIELFGRRRHAGQPGDRCWLYFNQPRTSARYLALKFVVSQRDCTLATFQRALQTLDGVARVKRIDAIVCDVWNARISDRLLTRWGWEPHQPQRWHRNYIKRFYGVYPALPSTLSLAACDYASVG